VEVVPMGNPPAFVEDYTRRIGVQRAGASPPSRPRDSWSCLIAFTLRAFLRRSTCRLCSARGREGGLAPAPVWDFFVNSRGLVNGRFSQPGTCLRIEPYQRNNFMKANLKSTFSHPLLRLCYAAMMLLAFSNEVTVQSQESNSAPRV